MLDQSLYALFFFFFFFNQWNLPWNLNPCYTWHQLWQPFIWNAQYIVDDVEIKAFKMNGLDTGADVEPLHVAQPEPRLKPRLESLK